MSVDVIVTIQKDKNYFLTTVNDHLKLFGIYTSS